MQLWKVSHSIDFPYCFLKSSTDPIQRALKTTGIRGSRSSPLMFTQACVGQALNLAAEEFESTAQSKASVSSVQFSHSVVSDSLRPHGLQHTKPPRPSPTPGACSNSYPSSQWCHPTISSYVIPFSSCLQSFPESGSFPMSQFFTSGGQSIGASASALFLPVNIHDWFPLGLSVWSPFSPCILLAVWSKK